MGTEYFEIAEPITRLVVVEDTPLSWVGVWMGGHCGMLTVETKLLADFITLFRGEYAGKVNKLESGRVFSSAGRFKPHERTQLISENGKVVNYAELLTKL